MFYSQFILAKKGPLGTIWIAAHLERKLRKNQVADTDIGVSVDSILFPDVPIALRLSSHLLLGVVRIYSRKVNYLFDDCSEALLKIKQAFRSTTVDLPPEESTAPYHSITLPETFDLDDFELPDNDLQGNYVDHHVSTRDQITLQDSMEGVVYTTSQFGLDERFGDGDASQIGLDLDEVLLNDKPAALEHDPQASHQKDEKKEEIDDLPTAEYAEGPSTPGLEEPNLFGTQMDQVNNEVTSADLISMETTQKGFSGEQRENDVIDCSLQNNGNDVLHPEDNDSNVVEVDSKRDEQEHLTCKFVTKDQENLTPNDHCSTSLPLTDSSNKEYPTTLAPESEGEMIGTSDVHVPEKEDLQNGVLMNNEPVPAPLDVTVTNCVVPGSVRVNENVASPSCSHLTSDQEDLSCKLLSDMDGSRVPGSDGHLEDNNTSSKNEAFKGIELFKTEGQSCPFDVAQVSNVISPLGSPGRPEVVDVEAQVPQELKETETLNHVSHEVVQPTESILQPCFSHFNQPAVSFIEGVKCHETDVSDPALGYRETTEPSVCKGKPGLEKSDMQLESQIFRDRVESIYKSATSDMPEPEKMLSFAHPHDSQANDLLMASTPDNHGISEGHTGAAGVTCISGKKRSFTESTLTVQSMDLESYGGAQSNRTAESIPDDDDLLSSILVGRRSSVLKIKPSPAVPEMVSTKRSRSAPRTSALKRKVHMDDMMVLHGDTIRQQLTNTEDIRRMRKKAPCTGHEILMIQRQFLEDEIFHESVFKDLSTNLTILRNETYDLTGLKVCDDGLDSSLIEKTNDQESYSRTNTEIHEVEGNNEPMAIQHQEDAEAQPTEILVLSESHQSEVNLGSHDIDVHLHTDIISHLEGLSISQNVEVNIDGGNIEVSEAENYSVGPGHEPSSLTDVFEKELGMPNDFAAPLPLMEKTNDLVGSIDTNRLSIPSDQNLNTFPILEGEFVENQGDRNEVGSIEHNTETGAEAQTNGLETNDLHISLASDAKGGDEYTDIQTSFNGDLPVEENGNKMLEGLNEDQVVASGMECDDKKDTKSGCILSEDTKVDCIESIAPALDEKESALNDEEYPACQEAGLQSVMCHEASAIRSPFVDQNDENDTVAIDTAFLNIGDDEMIDDDDDDDDDFVPSAEGTHLENSGWSSRTRNVAKYLQILFDKEDLHGRQSLHLDSILARKSRKEASRMFFETLVLKTRDYVHVEQTKPFANICIKPRMKLMKSTF
ncbi:hypothetical protein RJT34_18127 [Clitoria ternatea]|uniref:Sister chromatid cohesion 1 protein 4-like n=1 Tax=Clitoria ternatea TaxID=43366 RepID=A0AAN9JAR4_CLITE